MTQELKLEGLVRDLRKVALSVGPLHAWWDVIFDIQAFLICQPTVVTKTTSEWVDYAEKLLKENSYVLNNCRPSPRS